METNETFKYSHHTYLAGFEHGYSDAETLLSNVGELIAIINKQTGDVLAVVGSLAQFYAAHIPLSGYTKTYYDVEEVH